MDLLFPLWPWWLGAGALALVAVGSLLLLGRPVGVSSTIARVLDPEARRSQRALAASSLSESDSESAGQGKVSDATAAGPVVGAELNWSESTLLLVGIAGGGLLAAVLAGRFGAPLESTAITLFGDGIGAWAALFGGGLLVGFGTQMGGGCTSGHGLAGCGSFQPGSLLSTALFFGAAVLTSFALAGFAS